MQKTDPLIRTKLRLPFIRQSLISRTRLQARITEGLRSLLTPITAPRWFRQDHPGSILPHWLWIAYGLWLSLDQNDNQTGCFLSYLVVALQEADPTIGGEAAQLLEAHSKRSLR